MVYLRRTVDSQLDRLMSDLAAIAIDGPKGVGKTETAGRRATRTLELDDPGVLERVAADPSLVRKPGGTLLLDEWQRHPPVWDVVRREVDRGAPPGTYLLTGSAVPAGAPVHSGAGRIVSVRMRPMSFSERGIQEPTVSIGDLLSGRRPLVAGESGVTLHDYVDEIVRSGLPGIRRLAPAARRVALDGYLSRLVEREFADLGKSVRHPATLRAWLRSYAAATATTASYNAVLDAATPGVSDKPAKTTTIAYRDALSNLWMLDPVPGWLPGDNRLERLTQSPKHQLADPALAASLLGADADALLDPDHQVRDGHLLGRLFESLVTLEIQTAAQCAGARVAHLRTRDGRQEVDLLVERADGRVLAIEVKLGPTVSDSDVRHLRWLSARIGGDLLDAVVVTTGPFAYRRGDGIAVVPAALLGP